MPSAIGGLKPGYRRADIRCSLNERLGCATEPTFDVGAFTSAFAVCCMTISQGDYAI